MLKKIFIVCCLLLTTTLFSQKSITGKVIDASTNKPLASVSIFLSNTSIGTYSNNLGEFSLNNFPQGKFDIIISYIGYETFVQNVSSDKIPSFLSVALHPKVEEINEVVVGGYEKDGWEKWGKFFTDNFIGTTNFSSNCFIKNPEIIKFRKSKTPNVLSAYADGQLIIENKALGYSIKFQLEKFEFNFTKQTLLYVGYPFFKEMETKRNSLQLRWQKNRLQAYKGSLMHFMRSLYRNTLVEEGFELRRLKKLPNDEKRRIKEIQAQKIKNASSLGNKNIDLTNFWDGINKDSVRYYTSVMGQPDYVDVLTKTPITSDSIAFALDSVTAIVEFENYLQITNVNIIEPIEYLKNINTYRDPSATTSAISLLNTKFITVLSNGSYFVPSELFSLGYWAWWEKIATMLPFNFQLPK